MTTRCPACHSENPETVKFCGERGSPLGRHEPANSEITLVNPGRRDKEQAWEWLGKACDDPDEKADVKFSQFIVDFRWDSLRSNPRFKTLLKKMHLE